MKQVEGRRGQSMIDVAIQHCGNADYAYEVAKANGLDVDTVLEENRVLEAPSVNTRLQKEVERLGLNPCTGANHDDPWNEIGLAMVGELAVG